MKLSFFRVALVALAGVASTPTLALELVQGGYGAGATDVAETSAPAMVVHNQVAPNDVELGFTPRGAANLAGQANQPDTKLQFDLTVSGTGGEGGGLFALDTAHDGLSGNLSSAPAALTVGGAMRWSDWSLGGGLGRAQLLGENVDLMSASLGYGRVKAEIAYGQSQPSDGSQRDVLMLSTDLAAWSWLTLESDLALGSRSDNPDGDRSAVRQPVAAGRVGLRLNF